MSHEIFWPLAEVPEQLPHVRRGRKISIATVRRWIAVGVGGVQLEAVKIGGRVYVSANALNRFIRARNAAPKGGTSETLSAAEARHRDAERRLSDLGL